MSRQRWALRICLGATSGALATIAYDASRFATKAFLSLDVQPWEALPLFGQLLTGFEAETSVAIAAGLLYHLANGVGFGVTYTLLFGRRGVIAGIAFALVLEVAMLALYPGWLDIRAQTEFTAISIVGHVAYGATLGWSAKRLLGVSGGHRPS